MDFNIRKKEHPNIAKYHAKDFQLAGEFSTNIQKELGEFLKGVILFGSSSRPDKPTWKEPDIDILLLINDLTIIINEELVEAYRAITTTVASRISSRFHITTMKTSEFWDLVRHGDPLAVNMLRDGIPLYDAGFFAPMQVLLAEGKIRPTKESVWTHYIRAPQSIKNAEMRLLQGGMDLYWAVIDAAHAALMHHNCVPASPRHVAEMMRTELVTKGLTKKR